MSAPSNKHVKSRTPVQARRDLQRYFGEGSNTQLTVDVATYEVSEEEIKDLGRGTETGFWRAILGYAYLARDRACFVADKNVLNLKLPEFHDAVIVGILARIRHAAGNTGASIVEVIDISRLMTLCHISYAESQSSPPPSLASVWSPPPSQIGSENAVTFDERASLYGFPEEDKLPFPKPPEKPHWLQPGTDDFGDWASRQLQHSKIRRLRLQDLLEKVDDRSSFMRDGQLSKQYPNTSPVAIDSLKFSIKRYKQIEKTYAAMIQKTIALQESERITEALANAGGEPTDTVDEVEREPEASQPALSKAAGKRPAAGNVPAPAPATRSLRNRQQSSSRASSTSSSRAATPGSVPKSKLRSTSAASSGSSGSASTRQRLNTPRAASGSAARPGPSTRARDSGAPKDVFSDGELRRRTQCGFFVPAALCTIPFESVLAQHACAHEAGHVSNGETYIVELPAGNACVVTAAETTRECCTFCTGCLVTAQFGWAFSSVGRSISSDRWITREFDGGCFKSAGWCWTVAGTVTGSVAGSITGSFTGTVAGGIAGTVAGCVAGTVTVRSRGQRSDDDVAIIVNPVPPADMDPHEVLLHLASTDDMNERAREELSSTLEGNTGPFSLDALPDSIAAEDGSASQDDVRQDGRHVPSASWEENKWRECPRQTVKVSTLRKFQEHNTPRNRQFATNLLKKRTVVKVDDEYIIPNSDPSLYWHIDHHFLDFLSCVPGSKGWRVKLELRQGYKILRMTKHGKLGCDPSGRCVMFGKYGIEELWGVFVPVSFFDDEVGESDSEAPLPLSAYGIKKGNTRLSPEHFKVWQLFVCRLLESIGWSGLTILRNYPFGKSQDLRAGRSTTSSGRVVENTPIGVQYQLHHEAGQWDQMRTWSHLKYVSMAIASEIQVHQVEEYEVVSNDALIRKYEALYEHYIPGKDNPPVDLDTFPIFDENGMEIPLYDKKGALVSRRRVDAYNLTGPGCGLLLDLRRIHEMFSVSNDDGEGTARLQHEERQRRRERRAAAAFAGQDTGPIFDEEQELVQQDDGDEAAHRPATPLTPSPVLGSIWDPLTPPPQSSDPGDGSDVAAPFDWDGLGDQDDGDLDDGTGKEEEPEEEHYDEEQDQQQQVEYYDDEEQEQYHGDNEQAHDYDDDEDDNDSEAFAAEVEAMVSERAERARRLRLDLYPQAFLGHYGNIQANQLFPHYAPFFVNMEKLIREEVPERPDFHEHIPDGGEYVVPDLEKLENWRRLHGHEGPIIEEGGCQIYNSASHRSRPMAGQQEMSNGSLTQAATGSWATGDAGRKLRMKIVNRNELGLPHERFRDTMIGSSRDPPVALRYECNFTVYVRRIPEKQRTGFDIYRFVPINFIQATTNPIIMSRLKRHIVVFAPGIFPRIYDWTTFPVYTLTEQMYKSMRPYLQENGTADVKLDPLRVEFLAIFERLLAYAHTGNARVIAGCMTLLWFKRALLELGFPCIHPDILLDLENEFPLCIPVTRWPLIKSTMTPQTASARSIELTWGPAVLASYLATFTLQIIEMQDIPAKYKEARDNDPEFARAVMVADLGVRLLIGDLKEFVAREVRARAKRVTQADMEKMSELELHHHTHREETMEQWMECVNAFSHNSKQVEPGKKTDRRARLWRARLSRTPPGAHTRTDPCRHPRRAAKAEDVRIGIVDLAQKICDCMRAVNPHPLHAPLVRGGASLPVLRLVVARITDRAPSYLTEAAARHTWAVNVFAYALQKNDVMFIPWVKATKAPEGGKRRGPPSRKTTVDAWIDVERPKKPLHLLGVTITPAGETITTLAATMTRTVAEELEDLANEAAERAQETNPDAEWKAVGRPLHEIGWFVNRRTLPDEFTLQNASIVEPPLIVPKPGAAPTVQRRKTAAAAEEKEVLRKTYEWVIRDFDFTDEVHHLALIIAVVFSRLVPKVSFPKDDDNNFIFSSRANDVKTITQEIRNSDWCEMPRNGSGCKQQAPYIIMVTVYIIGLWDERSPLHEYLKTTASKALHRVFLGKHGAKGILIHNLIRMHLARGMTNKASKGGVMGQDWDFETGDTLRGLCRYLIKCFLDSQYGAYDAVTLLCGVKRAEELAASGQVVRRSGTLYQPQDPRESSVAPRTLSVAPRASSSVVVAPRPAVARHSRAPTATPSRHRARPASPSPDVPREPLPEVTTLDDISRTGCPFIGVVAHCVKLSVGEDNRRPCEVIHCQSAPRAVSQVPRQQRFRDEPDHPPPPQPPIQFVTGTRKRNRHQYQGSNVFRADDDHPPPKRARCFGDRALWRAIT
ncbi:uncharacterized protein B0H18DRAFT_957952 [Fomitopsis serialis]|uniref:uncharacterized protein n=1 Tax=Fomitopsis serialis TaxID=139415 RepID=UPI002007E4BB|nr:uncharacterized protein B0H18DRAFT_957952 [Neoantrodia serialis]KAH9918287.1 hypothetical protein B0H18DRAFT_957952 [Neoantrodia serialis]